MTQYVINVGAAPNDGQGDPLRDAFVKCNDNFTQLFNNVQEFPPGSRVGSPGDVPGMIAYDDEYFYYCFGTYDGSTIIWNLVPNSETALINNLIASGNANITGSVTANTFIGDGSGLTNVTATPPTSISNGTSNIIVGASANITIAAAGSEVAVFSANALSLLGNLVGESVQSSGNIVATGNVTSANVSTGNIVATGSVTAATLALSGNVTSNLNLSSNLAVSSNVSVAGTINGNLNGNVTATSVVASGNVSGLYIIGDGGLLSNVTATGNVAVTQIANGTSIIGIQGSGGNATITVGGVSNVAVFTTQGANIGGNVDTGNLVATNRVTALGNVTGGNLVSSGNAAVLGTISGYAVQATQNISGSGNITGGNLISNSAVVTATVVATGNITTTGNVTANYFIGNGSQVTNVVAASVSASNLTGSTLSSNVTTSSLTTVGTLGSLAVTGNVTANVFNGNLINSSNIETGNLSVTNTLTVGNIGGGTLTVGNISAGNISVSSNISGGNLTISTAIASGSLSTTTNINSGGNVSAVGNVVGVNLVANNVLYVNAFDSATAIVNNGSNGVGNIGSSVKYFNTIFAKATSAQYADLAECYLADSNYTPGTVLSFGGNCEVTASNIDLDPTVIGVVSTNPAHLMNSSLIGDHVVAVALAGRVPCRVQGTVSRGDMLVSAGNGRARAEKNPVMGSVIGKALESFNGDSGTIEIVVGRL